jgi:hypothetical protein
MFIFAGAAFAANCSIRDQYNLSYFVLIYLSAPCASARTDIHRVFLAGQSPVAQISNQSLVSSRYDTGCQIES